MRVPIFFQEAKTGETELLKIWEIPLSRNFDFPRQNCSFINR